VLRRRPAAAFVTVVLAVGLVLGGASMDRAKRREVGDLDFNPYYLPGLRYIVRTWGGGGPIVAISDIMQPAFPLVNSAGVSYGSSFSCLWMLPGLYARERMAGSPFPYHDFNRMTPLERYMIDAVVGDLQRSRPTLIIVDREPPFLLAGFSYMAYFGRDARFREIIRHYTLLARVQRYVVLKRTD
jgi:hypothetical protein